MLNICPVLEAGFRDVILQNFVHALQNPNALDSKVLVDFDHVKNSLKLDDEGELYILSFLLRYRTLFLFILLVMFFSWS